MMIEAATTNLAKSAFFISDSVLFLKEFGVRLKPSPKRGFSIRKRLETGRYCIHGSELKPNRVKLASDKLQFVEIAKLGSSHVFLSFTAWL